jgi:hypothetical protein
VVANGDRGNIGCLRQIADSGLIGLLDGIQDDLASAYSAIVGYDFHDTIPMISVAIIACVAEPVNYPIIIINIINIDVDLWL